ncbi:MAG: hypothetical protein H0T92_12095 [Pyrinomonadaceae bacterium]|nr:hypothetical protein [Pyrinomonadaceae bacterium]
MTHFLVMTLFALLVATVFGIVSRETVQERVRYGAKVFVEFVGVGLALAWVLYVFPR